MTEPQEPEPTDLAAVPTIEEQISFVLSHPGMSAWLKATLSTALERHPIEVLNDLEILTLILKRRSAPLPSATR